VTLVILLGILRASSPTRIHVVVQSAKSASQRATHHDRTSRSRALQQSVDILVEGSYIIGESEGREKHESLIIHQPSYLDLYVTCSQDK